MRLTQIRTFLAVIDAGTIRGAARALGVSPPAVTKTMRELEDDLQVKLLERSATGVVASSAGRIFVDRARAIEGEVRRVREDLASWSGSRTVSFGTGPTFMHLVVPKAVASFCESNRDTRVRIVEGRHPTLIPLVRDGTLDFALAVRPPERPAGLAFRPLFQDQLAVFGRRGHPLGKATSLTELAAAQWVSATPGMLPDAMLNRALLASGMPPPRRTIDCESLNGVIALLAKTDLLTVTNRSVLTASYARDLVQEIPVREKLPRTTHGILTRSGSPLTRGASSLLKAVSAATRQIVPQLTRDS